MPQHCFSEGLLSQQIEGFLGRQSKRRYLGSPLTTGIHLSI
jgi:hypothetical protein